MHHLQPVKAPGGPVYFLSDAHIGYGSVEEEADKEKKLLSLLDEVEAEAGGLIILGDLFDFWFEYKHAIPKRGFNVLARLRGLAEKVPTAFVGGNHDFWAGGFLERHIGVTWHSGPFEVESQGRRLYLAHGDGLAPGDWGYRVIRKVFRSRWAISAYRMIHPDLGIPLATRSSRASRHYTESTPVDGPELWRRIAEPQFARGFDAVLIGHFHKPVHVRSGGNDFVINGDLFRHWSYTVLSSGSLELRVMGGRCISPIII